MTEVKVVPDRSGTYLAIVICSTLIGIMALIGASFGTLGLRAAFCFIGGIGVLFMFVLISGAGRYN
jgi:hypothetical protein